MRPVRLPPGRLLLRERQDSCADPYVCSQGSRKNQAERLRKQVTPSGIRQSSDPLLLAPATHLAAHPHSKASGRLQLEVQVTVEDELILSKRDMLADSVLFGVFKDSGGNGDIFDGHAIGLEQSDLV